MNYFEVGGFVCSNEEVFYFNLMFYFLLFVICYDGSLLEVGYGYQVYIGLMYFNLIGLVKICLMDLCEYLVLCFNYFLIEFDCKEWFEVIVIVWCIFNQLVFDDFNGGEFFLGFFVLIDEQVFDWVVKDVEIVLYFLCICIMGIGFDVVIDFDMLCVYGIEGLCVVDVLMFFSIMNGNIYVFVMMFVECVSDFILEKMLFVFENVFFFCYD